MKRKMSMRDAMELVPDDLPDGAYWQMAHDIAGLEYGEGFAELDPNPPPPSVRKPAKNKPAAERKHRCEYCSKRFVSKGALGMHIGAMRRNGTHPPTGGKNDFDGVPF